MSKDNMLKKNFIWNSLGSTIYSFTSLFFMIIVTRINGVNEAGIFTFAFANACFLQVIGTYAGRTYQVTENNKNITDNDYVYNRIISSVFMILIGILFSSIKGYTYLKLFTIILLIIYKAMDAFCESIYGIIQKNNGLYKVGISLFLKGIVGTIAFFIVDYVTKNLLLSVFSLIIVNLMITLFYDLMNVKRYHYQFQKINVQKTFTIFKLGFWTFLFTFLTQYLINAPKYAIDNYLENDMQTIYGIIAMPATIMVLISNFVVQPFLLKVSDILNRKKLKELNKLLSKMVLAIIIIGVMALICAYFLGIPVLNLLYGIKLNLYVNHLMIIIIGATIFSITIIISNILVAMRKTKSQTIIFIITSVLAFILSNILVKNYSMFVAVISYLISMILLLILYICIYISSVKGVLKNG